jgi:hypothetical protein
MSILRSDEEMVAEDVQQQQSNCFSTDKTFNLLSFLLHKQRQSCGTAMLMIRNDTVRGEKS